MTKLVRSKEWWIKKAEAEGEWWDKHKTLEEHDVQAIERRIRKILADKYMPKDEAYELAIDAEMLVEDGWMDSIEFIEFIIDLEAEFGVEIDDEDLIPVL